MNAVHQSLGQLMISVEGLSLDAATRERLTHSTWAV